VARFFEATVALFPEPVACQLIQLRRPAPSSASGLFSGDPEQVAEPLTLVRAGDQRQAGQGGLGRSSIRTARRVPWSRTRPAVSDEAVFASSARNSSKPREAALVRGGKQGVLGFFVGKVMGRPEALPTLGS
jgi:hypothetical protein